MRGRYFSGFHGWRGLRAALLGAFWGGLGAVSGASLYSTSFNNPPFNPATGNWAGVDGWFASDPTNGSAAVVPSGGAVYLGAVAPAGTISNAGRLFNFDPAALNVPIVKIRTRITIYDSSTAFYDVFGFGIYNRAGGLLCAFLLDNSDYHVYFDFGAGPELMPGRFFNAQYFDVSLTLNFATSRASLTIYDTGGGAHPVFENRVFNPSGQALDLGEFDYLWLINSSGTAGDNAMLIDSFSASAEPNPVLTLAKGRTQRTRRETFVLRGGQAGENDVRVEWKSKMHWRWGAVRGSSTAWSIRLKKLVKGRNVVHLRMLDALGRTIDQQKVTVLRK
jgi:hypothetical protein